MANPRTTSTRARFFEKGKIGALIERAIEPLVAFLPDDAVSQVRRVLSDAARFDPVLRKFKEEMDELRRHGQSSSENEHASKSVETARACVSRSRRGI